MPGSSFELHSLVLGILAVWKGKGRDSGRIRNTNDMYAETGSPYTDRRRLERRRECEASAPSTVQTTPCLFDSQTGVRVDRLGSTRSRSYSSSVIPLGFSPGAWAIYLMLCCPTSLDCRAGHGLHCIPCSASSRLDPTRQA